MLLSYYTSREKKGKAADQTMDEIRLGDVVVTRKPHPCGGSEWTVTRTGADIKMKCNTCGRVVMLDRESFLKRRKALVSRGAELANPSGTMI